MPMKPTTIDTEFEEAAKRMIRQNQHRTFMERAMEEYVAYREFMDRALLDKANTNIFVIEAKYRNEKGILRTFEIKGTQTLQRFAEAVIDSMNWDDDHLHSFWFPDTRKNRFFGDFGITSKYCEDEPFAKLKTNVVKLSQIQWEDFPMLGFVFDFGDCHEFDIVYKKTRLATPSDRTASFPRVIKSVGTAPEQYLLSESGDDVDGISDIFLSDGCPVCRVQKHAIAEGRSLSAKELFEATRCVQKKR